MATFSDRMIAKYGEARWAEMVKEVDSRVNEEKVIIRGSDLLNHSVAALMMTGNSYTGELDKTTEEKRKENKMVKDKTRKVISFHAPYVIEAISTVGYTELTLTGIADDFAATLEREGAQVSEEWLKNVRFVILNHFLIDEVEDALRF